MTTKQFSKALEIARSKVELGDVDCEVTFGCGLAGFKAVAVTMEIVASVIRWQCINLDGTIDSQELDNMRVIARKKFILV